MWKKKNTDQQIMRVSFDLDEVLFVHPSDHKTEPELPFPFNKIYRERLRLGTPGLIKRLHEMGVEVWVYTSSYRTASHIRNHFRLYGARFDGIINAQRHLKEVQAGHSNMLPQKDPSRYHIALHVDDESVIASYGREYGFEVYQLDAQDDDWAEKIIDRVKTIRQKIFPGESSDQ